MSWRLVSNPDLPIIELVFEGLVDADALDTAARHGLALATEKDTWRFLVDCSGMEGGHDVGDVYQLAEMISGVHARGRFMDAVVLPRLPEAAVQARFWQTTASHRGLKVEMFRDRASALIWLLGADVAPDATPDPRPNDNVASWWRTARGE